MATISPGVKPAATPSAPPGSSPLLHPGGLTGLIGETAQYYADRSGADLAPLALGLITAIGAYLGPRLWVPEPAPERQYARLYGLVVGPTSSGKEQCAQWPLDLLRRIDPEWVARRTLHGVSSGEGLIEAIQTIEKADGVPGYEGQTLLVLTELGQLLAQLQREGSTTLPVILRLWDNHGGVAVPTRKNPLALAQSHVGLIGMMTPKAFRRDFTDRLWECGFANRFLLAINSGIKPPSAQQPLEATEYNRLLTRWRDVIQKWPQAPTEAHWSPAGRDTWRAVIDDLWAVERGGGDRAGRVRAKVLRLALIFAAADGRGEILPEDLNAGVAWVDYHQDCVLTLLGTTLGDENADKIVQYYRDRPMTSLTQTEICGEVFGNHIRAHDLRDALTLAVRAGKIAQTVESRPDAKHRLRAVSVYRQAQADNGNADSWHPREEATP